MGKPEFDKFATDYDRVLTESMPDLLSESAYFAEYKVALMASILKLQPQSRILDFGCGAGRSLPYLARYFPNAELWGYDVSEESLKIAAVRAPKVKLLSDWRAIAPTTFDIIFASNVFHHIPQDQREPALRQCHSLLAQHGQVLMFEHNPYNPLTRIVFERCPFDSDAEMLSLNTARALSKQSGFRTEQHGYTLFFPRPLSFLRWLEPRLRWLPFGAQYYVQMEK